VDAGAMARPVTVALIEDLEVVSAGVRMWIAEDPEQRATVLAVTDSIEAMVAGAGCDADVLVLDLELGKTLVVDQVSRLCDAGHRVVVFSIHAKPLIVQRVLRAGALAFLDKHTERALFLDTILMVAQDRPVVTPSMAGGMLGEARLSDREREALLLLFQGLSHRSIARRMAKVAQPNEAISELTVRDYIKRARAKFAAQGRPHKSTFALLASCIREGLIRPEDVDDYKLNFADAP
jgi:two-component system, NarL family, nitrate/nitrite response regulator NarL